MFSSLVNGFINSSVPKPPGHGVAVLPELMRAGQPWPMGAQVLSDGSGLALNVAVWAPDATRLEVCFFDVTGEHELARLPLPAFSDGVWHGRLGAEALDGLRAKVLLDSDRAIDSLVYGLRAYGPWEPARGHRFNPAKVLLDPYARELVGAYAGDLSLHLGHDASDPAHPDPRDNAASALKARVRLQVRSDLADPALRTGRSDGPRVPPELTVLCELHVKGASQRHAGVPDRLRGSYAGLARPELLAHYKRLGVTTLSLLPVHARADEARLQQLGLSNYWGYSSIAFLAPEPRYASRPDHAASEFRDMVDGLHREGFEVVLDVVYNHSAETDELGPTLSLRGLANARYYHLDDQTPRHYRNWSGCGNCLNLAEPRVVQLVIESLRHWVLEHGVDGFRFDLAPILARGRDGGFSVASGFFAALQADPVLSRVKLIAEPWDIGPGGYQLGAFPPGWLEWNDQFRDTMRSWWLRGAGDRGVFAHRFAASSTQFHHDGRSPLASVNFITAHDGFTLRDLVSYNHKHNDANGEHNRDGHHHNCSWNAGVEGDTDRAEVLALRARLQRALLATLLLAQGTPMLLGGDEIGHTQRGNNNAYCQDNEITWLDWAGADLTLAAYVARLLRLRRELPSLRITHWLRGLPDAQGRSDVTWWHPEGRVLAGGDWGDPHDRAMGVRLDAGGDAAAVLLLVNPGTRSQRFVLPPGPWQTLLCSCTPDGAPGPQHTPRVDPLNAPDGACEVECRSMRVLVQVATWPAA
ncbi:glycogen debranching protein GlgX [Sphaerotilus mobilis]